MRASRHEAAGGAHVTQYWSCYHEIYCECLVKPSAICRDTIVMNVIYEYYGNECQNMVKYEKMFQHLSHLSSMPVQACLLCMQDSVWPALDLQILQQQIN